MASERVQRRIERLLDQIEEAADQRDWEAVWEMAEEVLGFAPDNGDAAAVREMAVRYRSRWESRVKHDFRIWWSKHTSNLIHQSHTATPPKVVRQDWQECKRCLE